MVAILSLLLTFVSLLPAQQNFYLHDNGTVVFYGDSITDQRLYTTYIETFVITRYPQMPVRFVHSGWGGDRVSGGGGGPIDERLQRDVIAYKPTVMTIMLGMNDGRYRAFDESIFEEYKTGYEHILKVMTDAVSGLRITLIQPSPFDDVTRNPEFPGGYNSVMVRYGEFVKELAQRNHMNVADMNGPVVEALRKAYATDPALAQRIIPDRVHPREAGHLLMAESLLKVWGATPVVTAVGIDAAAGKIKQARNTMVTDLITDKTISWTQTDNALPMPVNLTDRVIALAVKSSDFMQALNQQTLQVSGLPAKAYTLKINGTVVGSFTADQLAGGLNLAELQTPMAAQAAAVHRLTIERANVHQMRWRQIQMPFRNYNMPRIASIEDNLDALEAEIGARQRAAAQPAACYYELIPQ
jgi:lysophospholipase L1-like esterase